MELIRIFISPYSEDGIWSIQLDGGSQSEFDKFFDQVNDIEWLHHFFDQNKADLQSGFFGSIPIGVAVSRTLDEAEEMENLLFDFSEKGFKGEDDSLQHLFKPLNNFEYA